MKINPQENLKIIAGLGNPGKDYAQTYHNAGFLLADYLISALENPDLKFKAYKNFEYIKTDKFIFIKPLTFMNESGIAISEALKYFKVKPGEILIAHDDSDIELGKYKIDFDRSSAGHNGIESIINSLKTKEFWRLRIGIRKTNDSKRLKAKDFVLKKITNADLKNLNEAFKEIALKIL